MNLLKLKTLVLINDLIRTHSHEFIADSNIRHFDAGSTDIRLASRYFWIN